MSNKIETDKKDTLLHHFANCLIKIFVSWIFLIGQLVFVVGWLCAHYFFPIQFSIEILQVLLLTNMCCIDLVFLIHWYYEHSLDRRIAINDYIINYQTKHDVTKLLSK